MSISAYIIKDIKNGEKSSVIMPLIRSLDKCYDITRALVIAIVNDRSDLIGKIIDLMRERNCDITNPLILKYLVQHESMDTVFTTLDKAPELTSLLIDAYRRRGDADRARMVRQYVSSS